MGTDDVLASCGDVWGYYSRRRL